MWFHKLTERERQLVHRVWEWKAGGKIPEARPVIRGKTLDRIIGKLWHLYSSYHDAVARVEEVLSDIERLEDEQTVETTQEERELLDVSVRKLKEVINLLEWIRSEQRSKTFEKL